MTAQTAKIKNGTIVLPKKLQKNWQEAEVYIQVSQDNIYIKRLQQPSGLEMLKEFRKIGKKITKRNVAKAIKWARSK